MPASSISPRTHVATPSSTPQANPSSHSSRTREDVPIPLQRKTTRGSALSQKFNLGSQESGGVVELLTAVVLLAAVLFVLLAEVLF